MNNNMRDHNNALNIQTPYRSFVVSAQSWQ
jgi:hypothetical protein